ncbi:MAG: excinuclease ABC subunit UvrA [Acidimicrobiaceae bacterium]|nr:excinuclease ABC subunit UvrA [Acidimicrobiaceae bacterium]
MAERLVISGAREHNLKDVHLDLPRDRLIVITGLSGSGKSSLAFDTIYAEGQRRYVESLSAYARQFLGQMDKPDVDFIEGLSPAISIDQKSASRNPRSTVGTITEVYDYLRLLFARIGVPHDPETGERLIRQTPQQIVDRILEMEPGTRFQVLAPVVRGRKGTYDTLLADLAGQGFARAIVDGELIELADFAGATGLSGGADGLELARYEMHDIAVVVDRLVLREGVERRLTDSVETALRLAGGIAEIEIVPRSADVDGADGAEAPRRIVFSQHLARPSDGKSFEELAPRNFSFNSPYGACAHCDGLGTVFEVDPQLVVPDPDATLATGAITPWSDSRSRYYPRLLQAVCEEYEIPRDVPWRELTPRQHDMLLYAKGVKGRVQVRYQNRFGRRRVYQARYEGIVPHLMRRHNETDSDASRENIEGYMRQVPCPDCGGARLNPLALAVTVDDRNIHDLCAMSIAEAAKTLAEMNLDDRDTMIAEQVLKEIRSRLGFLLDVGLDYLNLSRSAATLAGGEAQRIRLASQVGSGLVGVLYVLDEPSIGLHQRDNRRLIETLVRMRDLGNTVMVVEHDEETIRVADHVVDIGPGAGEHGGAIVHSGPLEGLFKLEESITGQYLSGQRRIAVPQMRRTGDGTRLVVRGARENNLADIDVAFPLQQFVCVTGVSGSGKSSLVNEILHRALMQHIYRSKTPPGRHTRIDGTGHLDKVIAIDQSPIGRTPRSNPATYTGVFDHVRKLFANTAESRVRGYMPGRFSFNVKGGRCEACRGDGTIRIEMHFLPDVYVPCEVCKGKRYNRDTLEVTFKGRNIAEVLDMPCTDALEFFANQPPIARHMGTLVDVGLGYVRLGQPAPTLSGGEAQRVKLSSELAKRSTGHTMYILDEPTTGLHFEDVRKLLGVLGRLVDQGNTVVVIEHNLDVVKTADWIIDLGPEGGSGGGRIVAEGTPEQVAEVPESHTGRYLRSMLC